MKYTFHNLEDARRFVKANLSPYQGATNTEEDSLLGDKVKKNSIISDI